MALVGSVMPTVSDIHLFLPENNLPLIQRHSPGCLPSYWSRRVLQKIPGEITFQSAGSIRSEIASCTVGEYWAWNFLMFCNATHTSLFVAGPACHGNHFLRVHTIFSKFQENPPKSW